MPDDFVDGASVHETSATAGNHWNEYELSVQHHRQSALSQNHEWFSLSIEEKFHQQCLLCPLNVAVRQQMPLIVLPLRVHLLRSLQLGCSHDLNKDSIRMIVSEMNQYWKQAEIQFHLSDFHNDSNGVMEHNIDAFIPEDVRVESRNFIHNGLTRGSDGRMQNRGKRQHLFLNVLLRPLNYHEDNFTFDIYFFDMTGNGSQGVCISRSSRVIIMGERSTKGYPNPTKRPHSCIAKTMAHELGHALGLGHPAGRIFRDGSNQCAERGERRNLMCGGSDKQGGGGCYLEPWQICLVREDAKAFLKTSQ